MRYFFFISKEHQDGPHYCPSEDQICEIGLAQDRVFFTISLCISLNSLIFNWWVGMALPMLGLHEQHGEIVRLGNKEAEKLKRYKEDNSKKKHTRLQYQWILKMWIFQIRDWNHKHDLSTNLTKAPSFQREETPENWPPSGSSTWTLRNELHLSS